MDRNVALIPIRSGSKSIKDKNINLFLGKPLVFWTIKHALESSLIDRVLVSTDSEKYAEIAVSLGAEVPFLRPAELAVDTSSTEDVMIHCDQFLQNDGYDYSRMVLLQCTSPIRRKTLIDECVIQLIDTKGDTLLTVTEDHSFGWYDKKKPSADYDYKCRPRRQDISSCDQRLRETGSVYVTTSSALRKYKNRLGGKIQLFRSSRVESFEIDEPDDWKVLEILAEQFYGT